MRFISKPSIKTSIMVMSILSMRALSFASNTVSDIPSSNNELRTIKWETSLYTDACDITQNLVFYEGSPVYLRISQPRTNAIYVFDKVESFVRVYNKDLFAGNLKFPWFSNMVPHTARESNTANILTVDAT